jgi:hypothetical protein
MQTALVYSKGEGVGLGLDIEPLGAALKYDKSDWAGYYSLFLCVPALSGQIKPSQGIYIVPWHPLLEVIFYQGVVTLEIEVEGV